MHGPGAGLSDDSPTATTRIGSVNAIVAPARACIRGMCAQLLGGAGVQHTNLKFRPYTGIIIDNVAAFRSDVAGTTVEGQFSPLLIVGIGARIRLPRGALLIELHDEMSRFRMFSTPKQLLHTPNLSFGLAVPLRGGV